MNIDYVMIDSGCNMTLLPIQSPDTLTDMTKLFPITHYTWRISESTRIGSLNSPLLIITPLQGTVNIVLSEDLKPYNFQLEYLRFHVCYEDAKALLNLSQSISLLNSNILSTFVQTIDSVLIAVPNAVVGKRRNHALLGQQVLGQPNLVTLQHGDIFFVTDRINPLDFSIKSLTTTDAQFSSLCENIITKKFSWKFINF